MKPEKRTIYRTSVALAGVLLVLAAALISNSAIERTLLSDGTRSLMWGATLFRTLLALHGFVLLIVAFHLKTAKKSFGNSPHGRQKESNWYPWILLSLLSLVALGLRLWKLNTDLWFDELLTLLNFVRLPLGDIVSRLPDQNNHILFSILSHTSVRVFGESAWAVRLPSVFFGVASLWALFLLGRRVLGQREALLSCALMTVSYHHIWFSQNARGYMGLLFFSLLATWLWLEALDRRHWRWWLAYALAVSLGMWTHLTMVFVVAAHAMIYAATYLLSLSKSRVLISRKFNWRPLAALALSVTLTLQLYALALPEFLSVGLHEVSLDSEWTNPWWVVTETLRNLSIGFSGLLVVLSGALMVAIGWWNMTRREWQAGVLMVLPPVIAGASMLVLGHNLWPRFFFFCMGFALLIAVHGALYMPRLISKQLRGSLKGAQVSTAAGFALASLMIVASAVTVPRNYSHPKQDYTGARDYVESQRGPSDVVVAVGLAGIAYKSYFAPNWAEAQTESELDAIRQGNKDVWLIYTIPVEVKAYRRDVWQTIQSDFGVVKIFPGTLGGGEVVVCRQLPVDKRQLALGHGEPLRSRY